MARAPVKNAHKVTVLGPFDRRRCQVEYDPERGLTRQSFKDECDVNRIVDTYARTGIIPAQRLEPHYGEAPESTLFEAACAQAAIRSAEADGFEYPSESSSEPAGDEISEEAGSTPAEKTAPEGASQPADGESSGE